MQTLIVAANTVKRLVAFVIVLLLASTAHAGERSGSVFDWPSTTTLIVGQAADLATTLRFLHNGSGCVESNSLLGARPSIAKLVAVKAGSTAAFVGLQWITLKAADKAGPDRRALRALGKALGYFTGGLGVVDAIHNVRGCGL